MRFLCAFLLFCLLFLLCWPLAVLALMAFPLVWLVCLPFRMLFWLLEGALGVLRGIIRLPARMLGGLKP